MAEFKKGDIFVPKKGSTHHKRYGDFVGRITDTKGKYGYTYWDVLEEGLGNSPVIKGNNASTIGMEDFEIITDIYNSPLWRALT